MAERGSLDLLGPSTKRAVAAVLAGTPPEEAGATGDTNGAAMRITPVGIAVAADPAGIAVAADPAHPADPADPSTCRHWSIRWWRRAASRITPGSRWPARPRWPPR